jgi:hypothetical protein
VNTLRQAQETYVDQEKDGQATMEMQQVWNGTEPVAADDEVNSDGFIFIFPLLDDQCLDTVSGHSVSSSNTPSHSVPFDERCSVFLTPLVRGHALAQLVKALPYKPAGRGFDSRCHWNFSVT